ncbi:FAD-dependent oxidoreductase [Streptomyces sp. NPDC056632]|uniref:FAD-dependent oxidoreductase n=1 Tax=Streptomyces sp. NPDC056632 TaxID=3345884 RepID=UPI00369FEA81
MSPDVDAVVIGAGNAGLAAAVTLQRAGVRTLLVERHNVPGGCATSFRRGRYEFEVALHQLSGIGAEGQAFTLRGLLEDLGVAGKLDFVEERDLYRAVVPGRYDVTVPADRAGAVDALEAAFPGNRHRVERFLRLVGDVAFWQVAAMRGLPADRIDPLLFRQGLRPLGDVLDEHFDDPGLKSVLATYWTYLGQPPSRLAFQDLALVLFAYLEFKPWHIRGGSQALSTALLDSFLAAGGEARFHTEAEALLTERGRVVGVRFAGGEEVSARDVVSNASLPVTYGMLGEAVVPARVRADLASRRVGVSGFVLHMGLDATPAELGFTASTTFVNADLDDARTYASWRTLEPARGICVSSYDVAPIGFAPSGATHVSLMTLQYGDVWERIPPAAYARTKFAYAETLLDRVGAVAPGIRDAIEEVDVATPLTMARYLGHPGGAIYGYDQDRTESWLFRDSLRDPGVPGLHLAGSWAGSGGFQPTLESGYRVARRLLKAGAGRDTGVGRATAHGGSAGAGRDAVGSGRAARSGADVGSVHALAPLFDGYEAVRAEIDGRPADTADHAGRTRRLRDVHHPARLTLTVDAVVPETPSTVTLRLRRTDGSDLPPFLAGQYVAVHADGTSRPYAISSSPARRDHWDLTVRRVPGGRISNHLADTVRPGDTLTTSGPQGTFHHNPLFHGEDVVFLAGGSGVVPAMSMIRDILDHGLERRFHLLYGSRSAGDILFREELDAIAAHHPRIRVDHVVAAPEPDAGWSGATGFLTSALIRTLAGPLDGRMVYVCGPQALYPYALGRLAELGHPRRRIRFEANGAPADPAGRPHWPAGVDPAAEVTVTAAGRSFRTRRDRPLLDALEDQGIRPEAGCRSGECSLCRVRVVKGTVHSAEEARPRLSDAPSGYAHSCVAYPLTDVELEV